MHVILIAPQLRAHEYNLSAHYLNTKQMLLNKVCSAVSAVTIAILDNCQHSYLPHQVAFTSSVQRKWRHVANCKTVQLNNKEM